MTNESPGRWTSVRTAADRPPARAKPHPLVWKFGGTSVGSPERLGAIARRIAAAHRNGHQIVAVLSAMGDTTNDLIDLAGCVASCHSPREMDQLMAVGETISCALAAMALGELGIPATSFTGQQAGIRTDDSHGDACLSDVHPLKVVAALEHGRVAVVTGFQGLSPEGSVTTLGRGGSDATAIALAAALGLGSCDIYSDVDGVCTADPRVVPTAEVLPDISHLCMLALARGGAQVMQPRAVELGKDHHIDIHVRSSLHEEAGTWIREDESMFESRSIVGVAHRLRDPLYIVPGRSWVEICNRLAAAHIRVAGLTSENGRLRFTAPGVDAIEVLARLEGEVSVTDSGSVTLVIGTSTPCAEVTARALKLLASAGIEVVAISVDVRSISIYIPTADVLVATQLLHDALVLPAPDPVHELIGVDDDVA